MPPPFVRVEDMKRRYEREAVITASPVARLIDELIISLHMADAAFERGDLEAVDDALCRAQDILLALRTVLWGVAADLAHMYREFRDADLKKNGARQLGAEGGGGARRGLATRRRTSGAPGGGRRNCCGGE